MSPMMRRRHPEAPRQAAQMRDRVGLLVILVAVTLVGAHFVDDFPNGWDPTEYAWCVRDGRLPHSPYIAHFLAARLLAIVFDPPLALSLLSLLAGLAALLALYGIRLREGAGGEVALCATTIMAASHVFIRQSTTQEVYALQCAGMLASVLIVQCRFRFSVLLCAFVFGTTVAVHQGALFIAPALLYRHLQDRDGPRAVAFAWGVGIVVLAWIGVIGWLFPFRSEATRIQELVAYLSSIAPHIGSVAPSDLARSGAELLHRLTSSGIPMTRGPTATGPTGLNGITLAVALLGAGMSLTRNRPLALFWLLYAAPFFCYELAVGVGVDWGVYLPFAVPPVAVFATEAISRACEFAQQHFPRVGPLVRALPSLATLVLIAPSLWLLASHWDDPHKDELDHYRPHTLAALWIAQHAPADTITISPRAEPNANLLPYYGRRTPLVLAKGRYPMVLEDRGPYTPMNLRSYARVTTRELTRWLGEGQTVLAFEIDPFASVPLDVVDSERFRWEPAGVADTASALADLSLDETLRSRLETPPIPLYRLRDR